MPVIDTTRGNAGKSTRSARRRARRAAPKPYTPPPTRSDAAQRTGAKPVKRRTSPNKKYEPPRSFRTEASRGGPTKAEKRAINKNVRVQRKRVKRKREQAKRDMRLSSIEAFNRLRKQERENYKSPTLKRLVTDTASTLGGAAKSGAEEANKAAQKSLARIRKDVVGDNSGRVKVAGMGGTKAAVDALDLAANTPSGAYLTGDAAVSAAKGDTRKAKKLWKDYKETSAIPALVKGDFEEAARRAGNHPVSTLLELRGIQAGTGRTLGAAARKAPGPKGFREKVRRAGSTERPNLRLYPDAKPGEGPEIERRYSKDIIEKGVQKYAERRKRKRGQDPNVDQGTYAAPAMPRRLGGAAQAGVANRPKLVRRVDTRVFSQDRVATHRKNEAEKEALRITRKRRGGNAAGVQLVAEGTARTGRVRRDLKKRLGQLAKARKELKDPERVRLNRDEAKHIRELLALPDDKLNKVVNASGALADQQRSVQARGQRAGAWTETGQAKRFYPTLQSHTRRKAGEERAGLSSDEIQVAAKTLQRRARRGKYVPPRLATAATREAGKRLPEAEIARIAESDVPTITAMATKRPRVGESKGVTRADFEPGLTRVKRRRRVSERKLTPEELETTARVLQRRSRRGKAGLSGLPEGGPVLVTQRPGRARTGARLQAGAPFEPMKARKGTAFEQGARPVGREAVVRQAVESEAEVSAAEGFQLLDREFGIPAGEGGNRYAVSRDKALEIARQKTLDPDTGEPKSNAIPLVPVNIAQFQTFGARLLAKQEQGMPRSYAAINDLERAALEDTWAAATLESGRGRWVLMPEPVVQRLREHASVGNFGPLHSINNVFKDVVLTSSSPAKWIGGNIGDLTMRTVMAGITPMDIARGRRIVRSAAQRGTQGEHAAAAVSGGGLYHASEALTRSARPRGIKENPARTVLSAPWRVWKGGVYALEHMLEELPQWGTVGKAMRQETGRSWAKADGEMTRDLKSMLKMHDKQIDYFANQLATNRAFEARIQKLTEDVIGRWGKISPNMRRALLVAPFAQWLGAAMRYTFVTLPVKHPIKTSVIAGISLMTEEERMKLGLSYFLPRDKQVQDYQMGSLPFKVGRNEYGPVVEGLRTGRMTSLGTAAGFPGNTGEFLFPQFAGALDAWAGTSFTNEQLVYPDWWPEEEKRRLPLPPNERNLIGLGALLESSVPFASAFRRAVLEGGAPAEPYSTILTPQARKRWDNENKKYVENEGTALGGILEWLMPAPAKAKDEGAEGFPITFNQRLYTYGAGKQIQEQSITGETLERWREGAKQKKQTENWFAPDAEAPEPPTTTDKSWFK